MLMKYFTPLLIGDSDTRNALTGHLLIEDLKRFPATDPGKTVWGSFGFSMPAHFGKELAFTGANGTKVINVELRERILPGKVIRRELESRRRDIESRQNHTMGRKAIAELKDEVIASLLPNAFIKVSNVPLFIFEDMVLIATTSAKMVDAILNLLTATFDHTRLHLINFKTNRNFATFFNKLVFESSVDDFAVVPINTVLRGQHKVVRLRDVDVGSESVVKMMTDQVVRVAEISLLYDNKVQFTLSDKGIFRRLALADILQEQITEDAEAGEGDAGTLLFDADVAITIGALSEMLKALRQLTDDEEL